MALSEDIDDMIFKTVFKRTIADATKDFVFEHLFSLTLLKILDIQTLNLASFISTPK